MGEDEKRDKDAFLQEVQNRYQKLLALKDFAISSGYSVEQALLERVSTIRTLINECDFAKAYAEIDYSAVLFTDFTYPTTIDDIELGGKEESNSYERFKQHLIWFGLLALLGSIISIFFCYFLGRHDINGIYSEFRIIAHSILAMSLGFLGAVIFSFFFALEIIPSKSFNLNDKFKNYARLLVGCLLGWLVFFVFLHDDFDAIFSPPNNDGDLPPRISLIVPFLMGYSTTLAVEVLNKSIQAVQITLGLDDKRDNRVSGKKKK